MLLKAKQIDPEYVQTYVGLVSVYMRPRDKSNNEWQAEERTERDAASQLETAKQPKKIEVTFLQNKDSVGWIEMVVNIDGQSYPVDISIAFSPFRQMIAFLEKLVSDDGPASFAVNEEGSVVEFRARKADESENFHLLFTGAEDSNIDGVFNRKQFVGSFVNALQTFIQTNYNENSWTQLTSTTHDREEDLKRLNLERIQDLL